MSIKPTLCRPPAILYFQILSNIFDLYCNFSLHIGCLKKIEFLKFIVPQKISNNLYKSMFSDLSFTTKVTWFLLIFCNFIISVLKSYFHFFFTFRHIDKIQSNFTNVNLLIQLFSFILLFPQEVSLKSVYISLLSLLIIKSF